MQKSGLNVVELMKIPVKRLQDGVGGERLKLSSKSSHFIVVDDIFLSMPLSNIVDFVMRYSTRVILFLFAYKFTTHRMTTRRENLNVIPDERRLNSCEDDVLSCTTWNNRQHLLKFSTAHHSDASKCAR